MIRRRGGRLLGAAAWVCLATPAAAQVLNPHATDGLERYYLFLRGPSALDGADPFAFAAPSRLRLTASLQASARDPCVDAWTSGSYARLGRPSSWSAGTGAPSNLPAEWLPIRVDLSGFAGKAIAISFDFRSDDAWNAHEGVFVDSIRIGPLADGQSFFTNGADTAEDEAGMLAYNAQSTPAWHATARRSAEGGRSWWFGNASGAGAGTYQGQPDPEPDQCVDAASRGFLMTPVVRLGEDAPRLEFRLRFSVAARPGRADSVYAVVLLASGAGRLAAAWGEAPRAARDPLVGRRRPPAPPRPLVRGERVDAGSTPVRGKPR